MEKDKEKRKAVLSMEINIFDCEFLIKLLEKRVVSMMIDANTLGLDKVCDQVHKVSRTLAQMKEELNKVKALFWSEVKNETN